MENPYDNIIEYNGNSITKCGTGYTVFDVYSGNEVYFDTLSEAKCFIDMNYAYLESR